MSQIFWIVIRYSTYTSVMQWNLKYWVLMWHAQNEQLNQKQSPIHWLWNSTRGWFLIVSFISKLLSLALKETSLLAAINPWATLFYNHTQNLKRPCFIKLEDLKSCGFTFNSLQGCLGRPVRPHAVQQWLMLKQSPRALIKSIYLCRAYVCQQR